MYDSASDPYCYPGTTVLINLANIREQKALDEFETAMVGERTNEALPHGHLSVAHYRAVHRHLFRDVYGWAGKFRTVRLAKGGSAFCYPEHISREMRGLFATTRAFRNPSRLSRSEFVSLASSFLSTLNAIHPFREGNGRTQLAFAAILATSAGHPLQLPKLRPKRFLAAMIASFGGDEHPLAKELAILVRRR